MRFKLLYTLFLFSTILASTTIPATASDIAQLSRRAQTALQNDDYVKARVLSDEVMRQYEAGARDSSMCVAFGAGGTACFLMNQYIDAIYFFTSGINLSHKYNNTAVYESCTSMIGIVYAIFEDYEQACYYMERAFQSAIKSRNYYVASTSVLSLVPAYCKLNDMKNARRCWRLQKRFPMQDETQALFYSYFNQGVIAQTSHLYKENIYYQHKAIDVAQSAHLPAAFTADAYVELGNAYITLGNKQKAIDTYRALEALANENDLLEQLDKSYKKLAILYKETGRPDSTLHYQNLFLSIEDSIFNRQQFNQAKDKLFKYEDNETTQHIFSLQGRINKQWWILGIIVTISLMLSGIVVVIFLYSRKLKQANRLLVVKNKELVKKEDETRALIAELQEKHDSTQDKDITLDAHSGTQNPSSRPQQESILTEQRYKVLLRHINQILDNNEVICDPNFSLTTLTKMVRSNQKYVSMVINGSYEKTFKALLNEKRIMEASRRLVDEDHYGNLTIVAIAQSVGYNSPTTFNLAFKKFTGITPTEYRKMAREHKP